ncbi:hypothetical protein ACLKA6_011937 [Drosophila palustris]
MNDFEIIFDPEYADGDDEATRTSASTSTATLTKTKTENKNKRGRKAVSIWSDEQFYQLIDLVEERPTLWDFTNGDYKNRNKREISWEEISKALDLPKDEVANKWNLLRQQFRNAHSKVQSTKSGQAAADRKPPNKFYSALHFMQPILSVDSGSRTSSYNMKEDSDGCLSELNSTFVENNDLNDMSSSSNSPSAITKQTPKRRLLDDTNVHRTALLKQACEYLANTKEDDEFDLWGKSVTATLRNFPDAAAVRLAKSKMNIIMASLEAGELTSSIITP